MEIRCDKPVEALATLLVVRYFAANERHCVLLSNDVGTICSGLCGGNVSLLVWFRENIIGVIACGSPSRLGVSSLSTVRYGLFGRVVVIVRSSGVVNLVRVRCLPQRTACMNGS